MTQTLELTIQLSEDLLDVAEVESDVQASGRIIFGWGFRKQNRAKGVRLAWSVIKRRNNTTGRSLTSFLKTSKTLQPIATATPALRLASCASGQLSVWVTELCCMNIFEGHQRSPGGGLGPSLVQRVEGLCVDSKGRAEGGELSLVYSALTSLCSVVDTSLPLPDTHLVHAPSYQSIRCNELAFGFTPEGGEILRYRVRLLSHLQKGPQDSCNFTCTHLDFPSLWKILQICLQMNSEVIPSIISSPPF